MFANIFNKLIQRDYSLKMFLENLSSFSQPKFLEKDKDLLNSIGHVMSVEG